MNVVVELQLSNIQSRYGCMAETCTQFVECSHDCVRLSESLCCLFSNHNSSLSEVDSILKSHKVLSSTGKHNEAQNLKELSEIGHTDAIGKGMSSTAIPVSGTWQDVASSPNDVLSS